MSTTSNRLASAIRKNKLTAASLATGAVALLALAGVISWSNTPSAAQPSTPVSNHSKPTQAKTEQSKPQDQAAEDDTAQTVVAGSQASDDSAVLGASTTTPTPAASTNGQAKTAVATTAPNVTTAPASVSNSQPVVSQDQTPAPATAANLVANPSAEENTNNVPAAWGQAISNGTYAANYEYLPSGRTGSHSLKVTVSAYTNGDAKWITGAIPVTAGTTYTFSNYYQSDVSTEVVAYDGTTGAFLSVIGSPAAAASWTNFSAPFTAPANVTSVILAHTIAANGTLTTDDYSFSDAATTGSTPAVVQAQAPGTTPAPSTTPGVGFNRALVSLTFDDGWKSIHTNGLPKLQQYGFVSTQYINSQPVEEGYEGYMTPADIKDFAAAGHEIAWHTQTHADLVAADTATRDTELTIPGSFVATLMSLNVTISTDFATPFGAYNDDVIAAIKAHGFTSHRSTDVGYNSRTDIDTSHTKLTADNIKVQNIVNTTTPAEVQAWVNDAIATNSWLVIVYHEVSDAPVDPDPTYSATTANFDQQLAMIKQSGAAVVTVKDALAELTPQL